ncbi:tyrosine-type recombinase/integrase [Lachnoclostridium sp. An138]|uniref:tyrosine-type recombinase/integrase n=1 Tax=Lachnoclostridium sp. An138 TaxID=1965560 RepID=UPI000B39785A|nr:tyrosine-type recombinase/integrase [Lachnoclostridium sp. An138]OUQ15954.1 integrase [Lachnoclostridium sp. An138]
MEERIITEDMLLRYRKYLEEEEKSRNTIEKYMRDLCAFRSWLSGRPVSRQEVMACKEKLKETYAVRSVNSMLSSINGFLRYCGWSDCCVRQLRVQNQIFCPQEKELSKEEYRKLVETARKQKKERLETALQTLCATGIRISELSAITVAAVFRGSAEVSCKGKCRQIFLPRKLQMILKQYIRRKKIRSGPVFITDGGKPWDRSNIWREMKALCREAGVSPGKVFPHNLRHLFARTYYNMKKDIAKLADILGHSSINTTRIYIISTGREHQRQISRLGLVL